MYTLTINLRKVAILLIYTLSLICVLASKFLPYPVSRVTLFLSILIIAISASITLLENRKINFFTLFLILYAIPLMYSSLQYFPRELADFHMLSFNHEATYVNGKILFFSGEHKSFYPLSYIMAKIVYDILQDVWFVHVKMFPFLLGLLFLCLLISMTKENLPKEVALYCSGLIILSVFNTGLEWWGYRAIGYLNTIVFLMFSSKLIKERYRRSAPNIFTVILLMLSIVMSESLMPFFLILMLLYAYLINKNPDMKDYVKLTSMIYLIYQGLINFVSFIAYRGYIPLILWQISELIENIGRPALIVEKTIISRNLYYPMIDRWFFITSSMVIYILVPFILFLTLKRLYGMAKIIPLYTVLIISLIFQIAARMIPVIIIANVSAVLIYNLYPLFNYAIALYFKKSTSGNKFITLFLLGLLLTALPINVISLRYPLSLKDPLEYIDDPRIANCITWYVENFLNQFWDRQTRVSYHESTHFQRMFLKPELEKSRSNSLYNRWVMMYPVLPTILEDYAEMYESIKIGSQNIIYNDQYWLLIYHG